MVVNKTAFGRERGPPRLVAMGNTKLRVINPEDLIVMKLHARRSGVDLQDLTSIMIRQHDELDWGYVEDRARELGLEPLLKFYSREN